jgi:putative DNA methylase
VSQKPNNYLSSLAPAATEVQPILTDVRTPYAELSKIASVEAHRKNIYRPPYYVHKWWARRTGTVFRGLLLDLLLDEREDVMAAFYRRHDFSETTILDPFMGGGTTVGEALRLGCRVVGCDLNPVAWFLVKQAMREVDTPALVSAYRQVETDVADPIGGMYATTCTGCGSAARAQYVAWIKQVPCSACGELADLHSSQVIMADMATKGAGLVDCPACGHPWWVANVREHVSCPQCWQRFVPSEARARATDYRCESCGRQEPILKVVRDALQPPGHRLRCLTVWCDFCGKRHQAPTEMDRARCRAIAGDVALRFDELRIPREEIAPGFNTNQMRRYGYRYWHQMFNPRQLAAYDLLFRAIARISDEPSRELLLLLASTSLELNSMFCGAKGLGTGAIRHVFSHHAFIPAKEPLEANVWGVHRSSGGYATLFKERLLRAREWAEAPAERHFTGRKAEKVAIRGERLAGRPVSTFAELTEGSTMLLLNHSSERLDEVPDGSVDWVVTDPPYADNVMYSELSDYFYVWLRQMLKDTYPAFAPAVVDDTREAVHNPGRGRDGDFYTEVLGNVFAESERKLKPGGRLAFTFHHSGEEAWGQVEDALVRAGFVVERWWPVHAEMTSGVPIQNKRESGGHLDIVLVCARVGEVTAAADQPSIEEMGEALAAVVRLAPADYRALVKADALQAATWRRATPREIAV